MHDDLPVLRRGCCHTLPQAAQRGQKQSAATQPDAEDPLAARYGDTELVQSQAQTERVWTDVAALTAELWHLMVR